MRRIFFGLSVAAVACAPFCGRALAAATHPEGYDAFIAEQAKKHGVPERLIHRVVKRESGYNPRVVSKACYGLMQIKQNTARSMGYKGDARGLLDPYVNMTYAIPYLANAYRVAGGNEDRAVALYAAGFYYNAKRQGLLEDMRTADSPDESPVPPPPAAAPASGLLAFLAGSPPKPAPAADFAQQPAPQPAAVAAPAEPATAQQIVVAETEPVEADVPLPPERPASLRAATKAAHGEARTQVAAKAKDRAAAAAIAALPEDLSWSAAKALESN